MRSITRFVNVYALAWPGLKWACVPQRSPSMILSRCFMDIAVATRCKLCLTSSFQMCWTTRPLKWTLTARWMCHYCFLLSATVSTTFWQLVKARVGCWTRAVSTSSMPLEQGSCMAMILSCPIIATGQDLKRSSSGTQLQEPTLRCAVYHIMKVLNMGRPS